MNSWVYGKTNNIFVHDSKDEKNYLEQCKLCKRAADEIIIVDTGSRQDKRDCKSSMQRCLFMNDDFSAARESLKHATKDWILVLDADESLSKESVAAIKKII